MAASSGGSMKTVSLRLNSAARDCICSAARPAASGKTANGLHPNFRSVNTSQPFEFVHPHGLPLLRLTDALRILRLSNDFRPSGRVRIGCLTKRATRAGGRERSDRVTSSALRVGVQLRRTRCFAYGHCDQDSAPSFLRKLVLSPSRNNLSNSLCVRSQTGTAAAMIFRPAAVNVSRRVRPSF